MAIFSIIINVVVTIVQCTDAGASDLVKSSRGTATPVDSCDGPPSNWQFRS